MFDFIRNLRKSDEEKWQDQINNYLDDVMSPTDRRQFEQTLANDEALQGEIAQRQAILQAMRKMPARPAPRNFTLTPDMVGVQKSAPVWYRQPTFQVAGGLTAIMLVALMVFSSLQPNIQLDQVASAPNIENHSAEMEAPADAYVEEEAALVEVAPVEEETTHAIAETSVAEDYVNGSAFEATSIVDTTINAGEEMAEPATEAQDADDGATVAEVEVFQDSASGLAIDSADDEAFEASPDEGAMPDTTTAGVAGSSIQPAEPVVPPAPAPTEPPVSTPTERPAPRQPTSTPFVSRAEGVTVAPLPTSTLNSKVVATDTIDQSTVEVIPEVVDGGDDSGSSRSNSSRGRNAGTFLATSIMFLIAGWWFWYRKE